MSMAFPMSNQLPLAFHWLFGVLVGALLMLACLCPILYVMDREIRELRSLHGSFVTMKVQLKDGLWYWVQASIDDRGRPGLQILDSTQNPNPSP